MNLTALPSLVTKKTLPVLRLLGLSFPRGCAEKKYFCGDLNNTGSWQAHLTVCTVDLFSGGFTTNPNILVLSLMQLL